MQNKKDMTSVGNAGESETVNEFVDGPEKQQEVDLLNILRDKMEAGNRWAGNTSPTICSLNFILSIYSIQ